MLKVATFYCDNYLFLFALIHAGKQDIQIRKNFVLSRRNYRSILINSSLTMEDLSEGGKKKIILEIVTAKIRV